MQEKFAELWDTLALLVALLGIGAAVPLGQALAAAQFPGWRVTLGRSLVNAVFTLTACAALAWVPGLPWYGMVGFGAILASVGQIKAEQWALAYLARKGFVGGGNDAN